MHPPHSRSHRWLLGLLCVAAALPRPPLDAADLPRFEAREIDGKIEIGYGLAVGDVDGDGRLDILLADKRQFVWYRSPGWERFVLAEDLTRPLDNVCIAAADLDGDGKVEVAVGAAWNPGDTVSSGSVHYLLPGPDRTKPWTPIELPREPTVHRMYWVPLGQGKAAEQVLVMAPLHGRGNQNAEGEPVRILEYRKPHDPRSPWSTSVVDATLHVTHNLDPVQWDEDPEHEVILAGREAILLLDRGPDGWRRTVLVKTGDGGFRGAGEVRAGRLGGGKRLLATVEPFHGSEAVIYTPAAGGGWTRTVIDSALAEGHAVACADLTGDGRDEVIVGWRRPDPRGRVGIKVYRAVESPVESPAGEAKPEASGEFRWTASLLDDDGMACEDLKAVDLDGDGDIDVVAAGRATRNLKVYWNQRR